MLLTGNIPDEVSNLNSVTRFRLKNNLFTFGAADGAEKYPFPTVVFNLGNLEELNVEHVLVDIFRKDGYDMTMLCIVAVDSELAQTKYINTPVDTLLFHMSGEVSFDDRKNPMEQCVKERILELFN